MNERLFLERVGHRVAAESDRLVDDLSSDDIVAGVRGRLRRAQTRRRTIMLTSALAIVLVGSTLPFALRSHPQATAQSKAPALGPIVTEATAKPIRFEDGTSILVEAQTKAVLRELREHGATIDLESGKLDVDVVHTEASAWNIRAGEFEVRVTGTRFEAAFDPEAKRLTVRMTEGTVEVSASCVKEKLSAPNEKEFWCPTATAALPVAALPTAPRASSGSHMPTANTVAPVAPAPSASKMLKDGDDARLAGNAERARSLYTGLRETFPRTEEAATAAFLLGRMAESSADVDEANRWYAIVPQERPQAKFAQESLGRRMELEQRRGGGTAARALAAEYLKRYPGGPHEAYARSVVAAER